jgi:hypothetical protein
MLSCLNKVKAILTEHAEPREKTKTIQSPRFEPRKTQFIYPVTLRTQQKAHTVKLLKGFITKNPGDVRAKGCGLCQQTARLLVVN